MPKVKKQVKATNRRFIARQSPKKATKKNLRKKLLAKSTQGTLPNNQLMPNINEINNPYDTNNPILRQNNLRNQLLTKAQLITPLGYHPQQYGNFSSDQRINDLRNVNQLMSQKINSDKVTLEAMSKEKAKNDADTKDMKKQIKAMKKQLEETKNKREMVEDQLSDAQRIELENNRQKNRLWQIQQQMAEYNRKNDIIKNKTEADSIEGQVHAKKLENEQLQQQYESNKEYQRLLSLREELKSEIAKNNGLLQAMKDPSFANPNKEMEYTYKELEKMKESERMNQLWKQKMQEASELKLQQDSALSIGELNAITSQHIEAMKQVNSDIMNTKNEMYKFQQKMDEYEYNVNKRRELDKEKLEITHQKELLVNQRQALDFWNQNQLNPEIKFRLENQGKELAEIERTKQRIKEANASINTKEDIVRLNATATELRKPLSQEAQNDLDEISKDLAMKELKEEEIKSIKERRQANFEVAKANARKAYQKNLEFNQLYKQLEDEELETKRLEREAQERDLLNKALENAQKAQLAMDVQERLVDDQLSATQQATFYLDNGAKALQEIEEKNQLVLKLNEWRNERPYIWQTFVQMNPQAGISGTESFQNMPIEQLRSLVETFKQVFARYSREEAETGNQAPLQQQETTNSLPPLPPENQNQDFGSSSINPFSQNQLPE